MIDIYGKYRNQSILKPQDCIRDFLSEQIKSEEQRRLAYQAIKLYYKIVLHVECPYILEKIKRKKRLPTVLSKDEIQQILEKIENNKHFCMVAFLYASGLRVSEVVKLKIQDLLLDQCSLFVRQSKGHKDRITTLSDKLLSNLEEITKDRGSDEYLFATRENTKYNIRTVQAIFEKALRKSGVQTKATCHTLRHSFATHLIESGTNIKSVKDLLGHKNVKTTMVYIHLADTFTKKIISPF